jgi:molybdopterin-guanine dinucleotide biosynthesis protein A
VERQSERIATDGLAVGVVLAGGRGSRIGGAKPTVEVDGRPLISYPIAAIEAAGLEPLVVAKQGSALPPLECPAIEEPDEPRHPLCGVVAALRHAGGRALVVVGCDMPFVAPDLLAWLASRPEPLVTPVLKGRAQPLPARYEPVLLPALERALAEERSMSGTIDSLGPRIVAEDELAAFGDPGRICFNVNTREDLVRAGEMLGAAR